MGVRVLKWECGPWLGVHSRSAEAVGELVQPAAPHAPEERPVARW